jgi:hypothetical protein
METGCIVTLLCESTETAFPFPTQRPCAAYHEPNPAEAGLGPLLVGGAVEHGARHGRADLSEDAAERSETQRAHGSNTAAARKPACCLSSEVRDSDPSCLTACLDLKSQSQEAARLLSPSDRASEEPTAVWLGWHYLSNAIRPIRPPFFVCVVVSRTIMICYAICHLLKKPALD